MKHCSHRRRATSLTLAVLVTLPLLARAEDPAPKADPIPKADQAEKRVRPSVPGGSEAQRARRDAAMAELGLTDAQRDQLRAAQKEQAEKARAIREDASLTREQKTAKVKELRDSFTASTKSILTPDQFEKWQKMQEARRNRTPRPTPGQPTPAPTPAPAK